MITPTFNSNAIGLNSWISFSFSTERTFQMTMGIKIKIWFLRKFLSLNLKIEIFWTSFFENFFFYSCLSQNFKSLVSAEMHVQLIYNYLQQVLIDKLWYSTVPRYFLEKFHEIKICFWLKFLINNKSKLIKVLFFLVNFKSSTFFCQWDFKRR